MKKGQKFLPADSGTAVATRSMVSPHSLSSLAVRRSVVWSFSPVTQGAISPGSYQAAPAAEEEAVVFSAAIRQKIWWRIGGSGELFRCGKKGIWSKTKSSNESLAVGSTPLFVRLEQLPRQHGEAESPTSNQSPHVIKAAGGQGPRCSALALWLRLEAKSERALGSGATVGVLGRGSLDLPACGLRRGSSSVPVLPVYINQSSIPLRGAKPREADDARLPQGRPHQAGS